jgi:hypothetical protein
MSKTTFGLALLLVVTLWAFSTEIRGPASVYFRGALWGAAVVLVGMGATERRRFP